VGHTEAHHAATAEDVIQSCLLAHRAIENALGGAPDMTTDPQVNKQCQHLLTEARRTLEAIRRIAPANTADPWTDPSVLANAVRAGLLDAPQLKHNAFARGQAITRIIGGSCQAVDTTGRPLSEKERLDGIFRQQEIEGNNFIEPPG
jgi:hypothetical protein